MRTLVATDFRLGSCQATVFTPEEEVSAARVLPSLLSTLGQRFDGEPTVLPPADGLPREVPRVILQSVSGEWRCEVASARINVLWRRTVASEAEVGLDAFFDEATRIIASYAAIDRPRVGRLAAVVTWFAEHDAPGLFLARHFCRQDWLNGALDRPERFELHSHKTFGLMPQLRVNSWVRNKSGEVATDDAARPAVVVEQDINSLAEEAADRAFGEEDVEGFFRAVGEAFPSILKRFYPEG